VAGREGSAGERTATRAQIRMDRRERSRRGSAQGRLLQREVAGECVAAGAKARLRVGREGWVARERQRCMEGGHMGALLCGGRRGRMGAHDQIRLRERRRRRRKKNGI